MKDLTDAELAKEYAAGRSLQAFRTLAKRHGGMVYSTCLRVLGDGAQAESATETVFLLLAKKAGALAERQTLAGWLHRTAYLTSLQHLRIGRRAAPAETRAEEEAVIPAYSSN